MTERRQCKGCLDHYPLTEKYFYRRGDSFMGKCITCYLKGCKAYRDANREVRNAKARAYESSERGRARRKAYNAANRERINEARRRWALTHYSELAAKAKRRRMRQRARYFQQLSSRLQIIGGE